MIEYSEAEMRYVASKDPIMDLLVKHYGHLKRGVNTDVFSSIVFHILGQLLSNAAAEKIVSRFKDYYGEISPERLTQSSISEIKSCGISRQKATAIHELAIKTKNGIYSFDNLQNMDDESVIDYLMGIKGVGRWTAEMVAEFTLGRLNMFCFQDVALKNGIKKAHKLDCLNEAFFNQLKEKYSPYCTVASLYYYAINDDSLWAIP